ncbi:MAG: hypothetical protein QW734_11095 [Candidatus Bathyarchaeia archaeon]
MVMEVVIQTAKGTIRLTKTISFRMRLNHENVVAPLVSGKPIATTITKYIEGDLRAIVDDLNTFNQLMTIMENLMNESLPKTWIYLYSDGNQIVSSECVINYIEWDIDSSAPTIFNVLISFTLGGLG